MLHPAVSFFLFGSKILLNILFFFGPYMIKESTRKDKFVSGQKKPPNVFKECVRGLNSEKQFITSDLFFYPEFERKCTNYNAQQTTFSW